MSEAIDEQQPIKNERHEQIDKAFGVVMQELRANAKYAEKIIGYGNNSTDIVESIDGSKSKISDLVTAVYGFVQASKRMEEFYAKYGPASLEKRRKDDWDNLKTAMDKDPTTKQMFDEIMTFMKLTE